MKKSSTFAENMFKQRNSNFKSEPMVKESRRDVSAANNEAFKERFQFILYSNDNIVCQRYFRIIGYNNEAVGSVELFDALEWCVNAIKEDLWKKSFVYQSIVNSNPTKATGFVNDVVEIKDPKIWNPDVLLLGRKEDETVVLSDGRKVEKSFIWHYYDTDAIYEENEDLKPWDITFKFEFRVDERPVYQRIWDGTVYPKHIRNSVDLANTGSDMDPSKVYLNSIDGILQYIKIGRPNLIYQIIKQIISVMSGGHYEDNKFVSDKVYSYNVNGYDNRSNLEGWRKATANKTREYRAWLRRNGVEFERRR